MEAIKRPVIIDHYLVLFLATSVSTAAKASVCLVNIENALDQVRRRIVPLLIHQLFVSHLLLLLLDVIFDAAEYLFHRPLLKLV